MTAPPAAVIAQAVPMAQPQQHSIHVRGFTRAQRQRINAQAKARGQTQGQWCRAQLLRASRSAK